MTLAFILIISAFCGVLCFLGWLQERKKPDPLTRYQARWPTTRGFLQ